MVNWSWYPTGGDWTAVENLTKLYHAKGHTVIPFSMKHQKNYATPYDKYFLNTIDYRELQNHKTLRNGLRVLCRSIYSKESRVKLDELLRSVPVQISHMHNLGPQITPSILSLLKRRGIPIIWTLHDYGLLCPASTFFTAGEVCERCRSSKYYHCILHKCRKNSTSASFIASLRSYFFKLINVRKYVDIFICPSKFLMSKFVEYGFSEDQLIHLNNMYDVNDLQKQNDDQSHPYSNYIIFVGRIEKNKGALTLLKAIRHICNVNLLIVGTGEHEAECREYVAQQHISNVQFLGQVEKSTVITLLRDSLFAVCPSEWYENFPYVIVEGMLLSKPFIGSRIGGIPELVIDDQTGYTFRAGDVDDLRTKILALLKDPVRIKKLGINARKHIISLIDPENHYKVMDKIFRKLLSK